MSVRHSLPMVAVGQFVAQSFRYLFVFPKKELRFLCVNKVERNRAPILWSSHFWVTRQRRSPYRLPLLLLPETRVRPPLPARASPLPRDPAPPWAPPFLWGGWGGWGGRVCAATWHCNDDIGMMSLRVSLRHPVWERADSGTGFLTLGVPSGFYQKHAPMLRFAVLGLEDIKTLRH